MAASSGVFVPLSQLGVRGADGTQAPFSTSPRYKQTPGCRCSSAALRMLLFDSIDGQSYIFDPESTNITFVSEEISDILTACQGGAKLSTETLESMVKVLDLPEPETQTGSSSWGLKLHLNHSCNLACTYCYADGRTSDLDGNAKGAYGGPVTFMQPATIERAAERFVGDAPGDDVTIIFFGGEPLLSERRFLEAVELVNAAGARHGKNVHYTMTTNATLLTERILDCLSENSFRIAVSIDGTKQTHDRQRPTARGTGSYDAAVAGLTRLSRRGIPVAVRMTAFRDQPGLAENHLALAELPMITSSFQFSFYGEDANRPMGEEERDDLFGHYSAVAHGILSGDQKAAKLGTMSEVVTGIVFKRKKQFQCGAGRVFWAVAAAGDVFPCHRFVGMSAYKVGNVADPTFSFRSLKLFEENSVQNRVVKSDGRNNCSICFAHNICGGGCAQIAAANNGKIGELPPFYCQDTRLRVQAGVRAIVESARAQQPEFAARNL